MSKLDYILSRAADAVAKGFVTDEWDKVNTKQQIKDLMLELIGEDENQVYGLQGTHDGRAVIGNLAIPRDLLRDELRKKVEEL